MTRQRKIFLNFYNSENGFAIGEFCVSLFPLVFDARDRGRSDLLIRSLGSRTAPFIFVLLRWFPRAYPLWSRPMPVNFLSYCIAITSLSHRYYIAITLLRTPYLHHPYLIRTSFLSVFYLCCRYGWPSWLIDWLIDVSVSMRMHEHLSSVCSSFNKASCISTWRKDPNSSVIK